MKCGLENLKKRRLLGTPGGRGEVDIRMETQEIVWGCVYSHEPGTGCFWNVEWSR